MKTKELRQKTKKELELLLAGNRDRLQKLKFDLSNKKLKNTNELSLIRREIAALLTLLREIV